MHRRPPIQWLLDNPIFVVLKRWTHHPDGLFTVSTRSRHRIKAKNAAAAAEFEIPLTVSDVQLRHEQLPFAYYFTERLDPQRLRYSLRRVLHQFPVVSGSVDSERFQSIACRPTTDSISLSFGEMASTMEEWLQVSRGHVHIAGMGHPTLLPIFDSLFHDQEDDTTEDDANDTGTPDGRPSDLPEIAALLPYDNLLKIRVTHFTCGGTALGVNFLHLVGDTASCVQFVQCWGREMRQQQPSVPAGNARAYVNVSGMMTLDRAAQMGIGQGILPSTSSWMVQCFEDWFRSSSSLPQDAATVPTLDVKTTTGKHEYVDLGFSAEVLLAMKQMGIAACRRGIDPIETPELFVSTNDMVTAFGWLLKRSLSGEHHWNIGMVLNMRRHCGLLDSTPGEGERPIISEDLFGNGITSIVAMHPVTTKSISIVDICAAARSIRLALQDGLLHLPQRLLQSRSGSTPLHVSTADSFSSTSWSQFHLADISFSPQQPLAFFHGHPSHPLPLGQATYASVIVDALPSNAGAIDYHLLCPSEQVAQATILHGELCAAFLAAAVALDHEDLPPR